MRKVGVFVLVLLLSLSSLAFAENALVGRWEDVGSVCNGTNLDPMGHWVEFKEDMTGTLFMLKEFPFTYTFDGDGFHIEQENGLTFNGKLVGNELILDNGIEYHFARSGAAPAAADNTTTAAADGSFTYEAIYCRIDNASADLSGERMVFDSQGQGVYYMADIEIPFEWGWQSDFEIVFSDALGDYFIGTAAGDLVIGVYYVELEDGLHEFEYVLRNTAENGSNFAPALPQGVEIPTQGRAYNALCCLRDGTSMECESDGLKLNADGTGTLAYNGKDYDIRWAQNGAEFSFIDQNDDDFEGIAVGDVIHGVYTITFSDGDVLQYEYVFETAMAN